VCYNGRHDRRRIRLWQWHQRDSSDIRMATLSRNRQQYGLAAI